MDISLMHGVASMRAAEKRLESITHNIANADTPGFKRQKSITQSFAALAGRSAEPQPTSSAIVDFTQGPLRRTEHPLHLALQGEGFFVVEGTDGERYTRNGSLRVDGGGVLQTADGYPLAWEGARGAIDPSGEPIVVEGDGAVRQGGRDLGRLRIVTFADHGVLRLDERAYWSAPLDVDPLPSDAVVHQGSLEGSNASAVDELVALIRVQRDFESSARLMSMIDQSYQRLTNRS